MSPVRHQISGKALTHYLDDELRTLREQLQSASERVGRTLLKNGPLRVTLVGIRPGGVLRAHTADGPITVQVLEGELDFEAAGQTWSLKPGALFSLDAGVRHAARTRDGAIFLLTVVSAGKAPAAAAAD